MVWNPFEKLFGKKPAPDDVPDQDEDEGVDGRGDELDDNEDEDDTDSEDEPGDDEDNDEDDENEDGEDGDDEEEEEEEEEERVRYSKAEQKEIDEALKAKKRKIQLPPGVDGAKIDELISNLVAAQRGLRKFKGGELDDMFVVQVAAVQGQIRAELSSISPGEAEIILQNISIDIEVQLSRGTIENTLYTTFNKLGEINVFNSELAETLKNLRGAKTIEQYFPTLTRIAGKGLNARMALTAAIIAAGGIVGGGLIATLLGTAAGAWAGWSGAKALHRAFGERGFNETMQELNDVETRNLFLDNLEDKEQKELRKLRRKIMKVQGRGKEPKEKDIQRRDELEGKATSAKPQNLRDDDVRFYAAELLYGAHRFEKAIGLKADGSIDTESVPAKLLKRLEEIKQLEVSNALQDTGNAIEDMSAGLGDRIFSQRYEQIKSLFTDVRGAQTLESATALLGGIAGGALSVATRILFGIFGKGQTEEEIWAQHTSVSPSLRGILDIAEGAKEESLVKKFGAVDIGAFGEGIKKAVVGMPGINYLRGIPVDGEWISEVKPPATATSSPDVVKPPAVAPDAKPTAAPVAKPTAAPDAAKPPAPVVKPVEAAPVAKPPVPVVKPVDASPLAKPTAAPDAKPTAAPVAKPTAAPDAAKPPASVVKPVEAAPVVKPAEGISAERSETPDDWKMLKVLGAHLSDEVQKNLSSARAGSFPAHERGTLLNVLYNLKEKGLISMKGDDVVLKVNEAKLESMYQESHARPHVTADAHGKSIKLSHWKEWFGEKEASSGTPEGKQVKPTSRVPVSRTAATPPKVGAIRPAVPFGPPIPPPEEPPPVLPAKPPVPVAKPPAPPAPPAPPEAPLPPPAPVEAPAPQPAEWKHPLAQDFYGGRLTGEVEFKYNASGDIESMRQSLNVAAGPEIANQKIKFYNQLDHYLSEYGSAAKQSTVLDGDVLRQRGQQLVINERVHEILLEQGRIKEAEFVAREMTQQVEGIAKHYGKEIIRAEMLPDYVRQQVPFDKLPSMRDVLKLPPSSPLDFIQDIGKSVGKALEGAPAPKAAASDAASTGPAKQPAAPAAEPEKPAQQQPDQGGQSDAGEKTGASKKGSGLAGEKKEQDVPTGESLKEKAVIVELTKERYERLTTLLEKNVGLKKDFIQYIEEMGVGDYVERMERFSRIDNARLSDIFGGKNLEHYKDQFELLRSYMTEKIQSPTEVERDMTLKEFLFQRHHDWLEELEPGKKAPPLRKSS